MFDKGDGVGRDREPAADVVHTLVCRRLEADRRRRQPGCARQHGLHLHDAVRNPRLFRDQAHVKVDRSPSVLAKDLDDAPEKDLRIGVQPRGIRVGEEMPEVGQARRAEEGIADGVYDAVGVAVAGQAEVGFESDAGKDQGPSGRRAVDVVSMSYPKGHYLVLSAQATGASRNSRYARSWGEVNLGFGWLFSSSATGWPTSSTAAASSVTRSLRALTLA